MTLRAAIFALLFVATSGLAHAQPSGIKLDAPTINFTLPAYNDEGVRTSLLRGNEARYISSTQIDLIAMQYTFFKATAPKLAETTLIAPSASVFLTENKRYKVQGHEGVRIVRDDIDLGGKNWLYETDETKDRRVTLESNVRVVFRNMNIGNILK